MKRNLGFERKFRSWSWMRRWKVWGNNVVSRWHRMGWVLISQTLALKGQLSLATSVMAKLFLLFSTRFYNDLNTFWKPSLLMRNKHRNLNQYMFLKCESVFSLTCEDPLFPYLRKFDDSAQFPWPLRGLPWLCQIHSQRDSPLKALDSVLSHGVCLFSHE